MNTASKMEDGTHEWYYRRNEEMPMNAQTYSGQGTTSGSSSSSKERQRISLIPQAMVWRVLGRRFRSFA